MEQFSSVRINAELNKQYKKEAKKRLTTKEELINSALEYYLKSGLDIDDIEGKNDTRKSIIELKNEVEKLRGAFFSYFKVHEKGYSMGTLKLLWTMLGYLRVIERSAIMPVKDEVLDLKDFAKFTKENEEIKDAHENTDVPEKFYKSQL